MLLGAVVDGMATRMHFVTKKTKQQVGGRVRTVCCGDGSLDDLPVLVPHPPSHQYSLSIYSIYNIYFIVNRTPSYYNLVVT